MKKSEMYVDIDNTHWAVCLVCDALHYRHEGSDVWLYHRALGDKDYQEIIDLLESEDVVVLSFHCECND